MRPAQTTPRFPAMAALLFIGNPVFTRHGNWMTSNRRGTYVRRVSFPPGFRVVGLEVRDREDTGIANLRYVLENQGGRQILTAWVSEQGSGSTRHLFLPPGALLAGIEGKEECGLGIRDLRLAYWPEGESSLCFTPWACGRETGRTVRSPIDPGRPPLGFEVREHKNRGLIDFRQLLSPRMAF